MPRFGEYWFIARPAQRSARSSVRAPSDAAQYGGAPQLSLSLKVKVHKRQCASGAAFLGVHQATQPAF
jgi:hypothetical protein